MTTYNWDLIERLLHEVQNGAGSFAPRAYAEQYAAEKAAAGEPTENLDHLKTVAGEYEKLLLLRGYIEPRPEEEGGTGDNFILTPRGSSLLSLIDSSIPGNDHPRQVLDEQEDALAEATFDESGGQGADCLKQKIADRLSGSAQGCDHDLHPCFAAFRHLRSLKSLRTPSIFFSKR